MTRPITDWEREERERIGPERLGATDRLDVARAALERAKQDAARGKGSGVAITAARRALAEAEEDVPVLPRVVLSDATPEVAVQVMGEQGGAAAIMGAEADVFGIADGRYSDAARVDELLRAHVGEPITVDRIGRASIHIARAVLTVATTLQPEALTGLRHGAALRGRGLYARILWAMPPHGLGHRLTGRDVPPLDTVARDRYARMIRRLLDSGRPSDLVRLDLADDALDVVYDYEAEIEHQLGDGGELSDMRDWAGKAVGQAVRLAALIALARRASEGSDLEAPIDADDVRAGVALMRALTTHARAVLVGLMPTGAVADAIYVLRRAQEIGEGKSFRDLQRAVDGREKLRTKEALRAVVDDLIARGCIRLVSGKSAGPGRPSRIVELHPELLAGAHPQPNKTRNREARPNPDANSVGFVRVNTGAENGNHADGKDIVGFVSTDSEPRTQPARSNGRRHPLSREAIARAHAAARGEEVGQ